MCSEVMKYLFTLQKILRINDASVYLLNFRLKPLYEVLLAGALMSRLIIMIFNGL